jgi:hypothetical protein
MVADDVPIIGSIGVAVVPDARAFWDEFKAKTRAGAEEGVSVKVHADTSEAEAKVDEFRARVKTEDTSVHVKADTKDAQFQMHLLRDAIIGLGPAAVPISAVAGGALLGLLPVAATVTLAIQGISKQMKSSALQGTEFAANVAALKTEIGGLQQVAAQGILGGLNDAIGKSAPLFKTVNQDVAQMSTQLGSIVSGVAPALVNILTDLNPLFQTFGNMLAGGAGKLEHWAASSGGIQSFVAYVQAEMPLVIHDLGQLVEFAVHLAQALAPIGHAVLQGLGVLTNVLNAIPVHVLTLLADDALSVYAAFRTYQFLAPIIDKVSSSIEWFQAKQTASAAATTAAALQQEAAVASSAAAIATAEATKAAATAEASFEIAAALSGTGSILEANSAAAAEAAIEFAAAMQAEADAAVLAAAEITAAAAEASAGVKAAGVGAGIGWAGLLGPLAAVGVGVALLTTLFRSNNDQAMTNQQIMDSYATSLQKSSDALADVNIATTTKNLQDQGALTLVDRLNKGNSALGLTYGQLALAVNGSSDEFNELISKLQAVEAANQTFQRNANSDVIYNKQGQAAHDLIGTLTQLRGALTDEQKIQLALAEAQRQAQVAIDGGTTAVANQARQYHVSADAYLAAQQAAQKSTDQANAQTLAYQMENNAAALLAGTLDKLSGRNLSLAEAQNQFESALNNVPGAGTGAGASPSQLNAVTNATNSHQNAVTALTIAEEKLAKVRANSKSTTIQIQSAELAVKRAQDAVTASAGSLATAQGKVDQAAQGASTSLSGMTSDAVALRGWLLQLVQGAEQTAEAYGNAKNSSEAGRQELIKLRQQIIDNAVAHGIDKQAVTDYINTVLKIPKSVPPTKLEIDAAEARKELAEFRREVAETIKVQVYLITHGLDNQAARNQADRNDIRSAYGNILENNRVVKFALGGEDHSPFIGNGTRRVFDEPETGGEAYLPLRNDARRPRAEAILADVANRFGGTYSKGGQASRTLVYSPTNVYNNIAPPPEPLPSEMNRLANRLDA